MIVISLRKIRRVDIFVYVFSPNLFVSYAIFLLGFAFLGLLSVWLPRNLDDRNTYSSRILKEIVELLYNN